MATKGAQNDSGSKKLQQKKTISAMHPFESFERFFDDFMSNRLMHPPRPHWEGFPEFSMFGRNLPKVDIIDRDNEVLVRADIPGVKKDDLEISLTDSSVTISAKKDEEKEEEKGEYFCHETSHGEFERTLRLPAEVNADKANAAFKNGVLKLTLPKVNQCSRRKVTIK